jgi:hypothetical protein
MRNIELALSEAERRENRVELLQALRDYEGIPTYPIVQLHQKSYQQTLARINAVRAALSNRLWQRTVSVDFEGVPSRDIDVFFEGTSMEGRLAPTTALVRERTINNQTLLGTLQYKDDGGDHVIVLNFSADLAVDPLLVTKVGEQLAPSGERVVGMFTRWTLNAHQISAQGVKSSTIVSAGNSLDVSLTLDAGMGPLALSRLTSEAGLPLVFEYKYQRDNQQNGELKPITLSIARREKPALTISADGTVKNLGSAVLELSYFQDSKGLFHTFQAQRLPPGASFTLPVVPDTDPARAVIPPEAVAVVGQDPYSLDEFQNIGAVQLVDKITVRNLLPSFDSGRSSHLQFVEITLNYSNEGTADNNKQTYGPFNLLATPVAASQRQVPFVRLRQGARHIHVEGRATYENGVQDFSGDVTTPAIELRSDSPGQITVAGSNL